MQNPSTTDTSGCFAVNGGRARTCTLASLVSYNLKTSFLLKFLKIIYFALQKNSCVKTKKTDHPCANFSTSLSNFSMHSFNFKNYNSWKIFRWGWRTMGERMRNFPEMPQVSSTRMSHKGNFYTWVLCLQNLHYLLVIVVLVNKAGVL